MENNKRLTVLLIATIAIQILNIITTITINLIK